jgi:hypothetical protein
MTILAVIHCRVLTESQECDLIEQAKPHAINNTNISKANFMNLNLPFRDNPTTPREESENISLHMLLYEINKEENVYIIKCRDSLTLVNC